MRINKNLILFLILLLVARIDAVSQDSKKNPRLEFTYLKRTDGSKLLKANLYLFENRISIPLANSIIIFNPGNDTVAEVLTNNEGIAYLLIDNKTKLTFTNENFITFKATYNGNDSVNTISEEIEVKDATLQLYFEEIDSVRTVKAILTDGNNENPKPISDENVNFYVPRMFSLLKIGEGITDEDGAVSIEFPNDLPGNPDSTIMIVAKLEEHEIYANIEVKKLADWGIPIIHRIPESHRALWTEIAPVWMIITLTIMLCGVWGHYIFVIIQLVLVKLESRKRHKI